jgi:hypothetical protein
MSRTSHPSAIHHVEFNGVGRVEDMRVLLIESGIALPERERVGLGAWLEERDLQGPLADRIVLADELVHAGVLEQAVSGLVDVDAVRKAWCSSMAFSAAIVQSPARAQWLTGRRSGRSYVRRWSLAAPSGEAKCAVRQ